HTASANRPGIEHFIAKGVENGLDALVNGALAPHHDGQVTRGRATLAAAHRRVQHVRAFLAKQRLDLTHECRPTGMEVDVDPTRLKAPKPPASASSHCLYLFGTGERGEDDIAQARYFRRRTRRARAIFHKGLHRTVPDIVDHHRVVCLLDIAPHARAHIAQTNKSNVSQSPSCLM